MTEAELRRHHRRARNAPVDDWCSLGSEHGREDALACYAGLSLRYGATVHSVRHKRIADRLRRFSEAGISEDRVAVYLVSHAAAFANHLGEVERRNSKRT